MAGHALLFQHPNFGVMRLLSGDERFEGEVQADAWVGGDAFGAARTAVRVRSWGVPLLRGASLRNAPGPEAGPYLIEPLGRTWTTAVRCTCPSSALLSAV